MQVTVSHSADFYRFSVSRVVLIFMFSISDDAIMPLFLCRIIEIRHNTSCSCNAADGIDLDTYHPTAGNFRKKYGLRDKFIVLGVANVWVERKGLATFLKLSEHLGETAKIVLVGLTQDQIQTLPEGVLGLPRTDTPTELAEIYTAADVFVNPSREETFGLTVAEAMACGTWPIVYADTACAEVVEHGKGQIVTGDLPELEAAIRNCIQQGVPGDIAPAAAVFSGERFGREVVNIYEQKAGKER